MLIGMGGRSMDVVQASCQCTHQVQLAEARELIQAFVREAAAQAATDQDLDDVIRRARLWLEATTNGK